VRRLLGLPEWRPGDEQDRRVPRAKINSFDMAALDREAAEVRQPGEDDLVRIERARSIWNEAGDPRGTMVEDYLRSRRLVLSDDLVGNVLRFWAHCPWERGIVPCLIVAFRSIADNTITAVHRIRVDQPERWPKAERKMLGVVGGSAVKLDPLRGEKLTIGEGAETCIAARQLGLRPVWALGSAGAIASLPILDREIDELMILAEPDDASAKAIQVCGRRYRQAGLRVRVAQPRIGDMNDTVMERANGGARR
jgi:hypothetical protein